MIKATATRHILCRNRGTFDLISFYDGIVRSTYTYLHVRGLKRNNKRHICVARAKRKYFCAAPASSMAELEEILTAKQVTGFISQIERTEGSMYATDRDCVHPPGCTSCSWCGFKVGGST